MSKNKFQMDDHFVHQLFRHATFQQELAQFLKKGQSQAVDHQPPPVPTLIQQITGLLSQNFKQAVDSESLTMYQTCSHLSKQIEVIKSRLSVWQSSKEVSFEKQRHQMSILSEICEQDRKSTFNTEGKLPQMRDSFMGSLLNDTGVKDLREEIDEKLKSNALNMSADLAKIETGVIQRLKAYELGVNKKIENIFKTMSSLFETMNDLQLKQAGQAPSTTKSQLKLKELFDTKLLSSKDKDKSMEVTVQMTESKEAPRRRSFLGFKY